MGGMPRVCVPHLSHLRAATGTHPLPQMGRRSTIAVDCHNVSTTMGQLRRSLDEIFCGSGDSDYFQAKFRAGSAVFVLPLFIYKKTVYLPYILTKLY